MSLPKEIENYRRRTEYPDGDVLVERLIHMEDGTIVIVYEDESYLRVRKVSS